MTSESPDQPPADTDFVLPPETPEHEVSGQDHSAAETEPAASSEPTANSESSTETESVTKTAAKPLPKPPSLDEGTIEIRGLTHHYGDGEKRTQILHGIDLSVHAGELIIMMGPSGCGKSTLLVLAGTLRRVQAGSLKLDGTELLGVSDREILRLRRKIGFIFQAHNLFESLTAYQNVKMSLELHGKVPDERERITELLTRLDLGDRIHHTPSELSGGQKQRVAVARGLVHRPKLILADEPTAALDKHTSGTVITMLRELADAGSSVIVVTHDDRILDLADRIVRMEDGRIKEDVHLGETEIICRFLMDNDLLQKSFSPHWLAEVAKKMVRRDFKPGEAIIRQDEPGEEFFLIRAGKVRVLRHNPGEDQKELAKLGPGDFFGEAALILDQPRNATVIAEDEVTCYTLAKQDFQELLGESASFDKEIKKVLYARR